MIFRSKKDWSFVLVASIIFGSPILILNVARDAEGQLFVSELSAIAAGIIFGTTVLLLTLPIRYELEESDLLISSGPYFRWRIPYSAIEFIEPTRSPLNSPAMSLDRLRIAWLKAGKVTEIMISPENEVEFLSEIARRSGNHRLRGNRLTKA